MDKVSLPLSLDLRRAFENAHRTESSLIRAGDLMGLSRGTVATACTVSPNTVSNWATGRFPIPQKHRTTIIQLLDQALQTAHKLLAEAAMEAGDDLLVEISLKCYAKKIREAEALLEAERG